MFNLRDKDKVIIMHTYKGPKNILNPGINFNRGSVAFFVKWHGAIYAITASHLWGPGRWETNLPVHQFTQVVGYLEKWIAYQDFETTRIRTEIPADIAAVRLLPEILCTNQLLERNIKLNGFAEPKVGQPVITVGCKTGQKIGFITEIGNGRSFDNFRLQRYFLTSHNLMSGDSGCLCCTMDGQVLGVLAGGNDSGIFSYAIDGMAALGMEDAELIQDTVIHLPINKNSYLLDGKEKTLDVSAQIINGRTMVPIRFIAEALGAEVDWFPKTGKTEFITIRKGCE